MISSMEDDGDFVDFGLVGLREQGFEHNQINEQVQERHKHKLHQRHSHHHNHHHRRAPSSDLLLQVGAVEDDNDANKTHVVFHNGKAQFVPATHKINGESARLAEPYQFRILSLDSNIGIFKMKQYNRTHLSEMRELFEDVI